MRDRSEIASMFNHPDPPLKFWDGWWGTSIAPLGWNLLLSKPVPLIWIKSSHLQFYNIPIGWYISKCHSKCKRPTWVKSKFAGIDIHLATCSWEWPLTIQMSPCPKHEVESFQKGAFLLELHWHLSFWNMMSGRQLVSWRDVWWDDQLKTPLENTPNRETLCITIIKGKVTCLVR